MRFVGLSLLQCLLLSSGQVFLKLAMVRMRSFEWSWRWFGELATNWHLAACGATMGGATVLWLYILRHFPFSQAYPFTSLSFVFGMLAAVWVFGEQVSAVRWIGVALIVAGVFLIAKQ